MYIPEILLLRIPGLAGRELQQPTEWAVVLSQALSAIHKADFHKKERKKMIGVIFYVPY